MSNLRWIVRDGEKVLQEGEITGWIRVGKELPVEPEILWKDIPIAPEKTKKSLAQVLYESYHPGSIPWEHTILSGYFKELEKVAISYLEKEGWRKNP